MAHEYAVKASERVFTGGVIAVERDLVTMPEGGEAYRDSVRHPGAVGVIAYDAHDRILLLLQYRHPVARRLWELPAGLLDVADEPASAAAKRELAEEANLSARQWDTLVDTYTSPGMTDEAIRLYLARGIEESPATAIRAPTRKRSCSWNGTPLDEAVFRVMQGDITNAMAVVGILATARARDRQFQGLRAVDAAWPARPAHAG